MTARGTTDAPVANPPAPRNTYIRIKRVNEYDPIEHSGVSAVESAFRDVQVHAGDIWELVARPVPLPAVATLDALLQESLPKLIDLEVRVVDASRGQFDKAQTIPTLKLLAPKLPELRSLVLVNSAAYFTPHLVSRLYRLKMINQPGRANTLPLAPFLICLGFIDCLEELAVHNCFAPASSEDPGGPLPQKGCLKFVKIEDFPVNISHMLSAIIFAPNADISVKGNLRGASTEHLHSAFMTMLPRDRNCLPILKKFTNVSVRCAPETAYIFAKVADSVGFLCLEVITDIPDTTTASYTKSRGELYDAMVRGFGDLFPDAPIEDLEFIGDNEYLPRATWVAAMDRFPLIRRLDLDVFDTGIAESSPFEFLSALEKSSLRRPSDLLCAYLEDLTLYGTAPGTDLLEAMRRCFNTREERGGCAVIPKLEVNLYGGEHLRHPIEKALCKESFFGLAERLVVDVYTAVHDIEALVLLLPYDECSIQ